MASSIFCQYSSFSIRSSVSPFPLSEYHGGVRRFSRLPDHRPSDSYLFFELVSINESAISIITSPDSLVIKAKKIIIIPPNSGVSK